MKKKLLLFVGTVVLALGGRNVQAALAEAVQVEIVSPDFIETTPIYEGNVDIVVTNQSDVPQRDLNCFLTVVDEERKQSFPMDEFGTDSYQTRNIDILEPGESVTITIPLRIMYVGKFKLVANVADYATNQVYAADSLPITMISNTNLHKPLVIGVSAAMPTLLAGMTLALSRKRGRRKA